ncbi:MAG: sugar phosphate isomerase/epimerase [Bryobacterales bacterium]|nr:sugar phosphate isomerase/epimerase [Bryobacterales bacterium]
MLIGAMNHPSQDVVSEIRWMADLGLDFVDLTLEPPTAASWRVDTKAIRRTLNDHNLAVVGHTAFYLPLCSPFENIRQAAVDELRRCLDLFSEVGAPCMNVHPDRHAPMHDRAFYIQRNIETLATLLDHARQYTMCVMIENLPGDFNSAHQLGELLVPLPELALHLDIGHANLLVPRNTTCEILAAYGKRVRHVHLHDNKGGHMDLHLPLGAGNLDLPAALRALQECGYDGTITLEVFTTDRHYLTYSRDVLRRTWDTLKAQAAESERTEVTLERMTAAR